MNIIIRLPEKTGFDIEVDDNLIHSLYEHTEQTLFLKKGKHSITIKDQAPTPSLWYKILKFFNPLSDIVENFSTEKTFTLKQEAMITLKIVYGNFAYVEITPNSTLSQIIIDQD